MKSNRENQTIHGSQEEDDTEEGRSTEQGKGEGEGQELGEEVREARFVEGQWQDEQRNRLQGRAARGLGRTAGAALIFQLE